MKQKNCPQIDAKVLGANRLKFTSDGNQVFISSFHNGELTICNSKTQKQIINVQIGKGATGILTDLIYSWVFVAFSPDNYIAIINLKTLMVIGRLNVGGIPDGLAWPHNNSIEQL